MDFIMIHMRGYKRKLGLLCGNSLAIDRFMSSGPSMIIEFRSLLTDVQTATGFMATYEFIEGKHEFIWQ